MVLYFELCGQFFEFHIYNNSPCDSIECRHRQKFFEFQTINEDFQLFLIA